MEVGRKRTCGFPWVSRHPVLMLAVEAPLCQIPLLSLQQQESCRQCLGHRVTAGASKVTHTVYGRAVRQTGINICMVCSLLHGCGEGGQSRDMPMLQPEPSSGKRKGWVRRAQTLSYHTDASPLPCLPPELEKYPIWWKTCFCCTSSISCVWRGSAALGISPQPCPCQPPASLTATFGLG